MTSKARTRVSLGLDAALLKEIDNFAAQRNLSRPTAIEAAIACLLQHNSAGQQEAPLSRRLDRFSLQIARLDEDLTILGEAFALFVRFWLSVTPPLPPAIQNSATARGADRYDAFLQALGRRLAQGDSFLREVCDDANSRDDSQSHDALTDPPPP